jgi:hypothetical protein
MSPRCQEHHREGAGTDFDSKVVEAFLTAFRFGELDSRTTVAVASVAIDYHRQMAATRSRRFHSARRRPVAVRRDGLPA